MTGHGKVKALFEEEGDKKIKLINEESKIFRMEIFVNPYIDDQVILSQGKNTIYLEMEDIPSFVDILNDLREESQNQSSTTEEEK